jgi:hypothetical protein
MSELPMPCVHESPMHSTVRAPSSGGESAALVRQTTQAPTCMASSNTTREAQATYAPYHSQ